MTIDILLYVLQWRFVDAKIHKQFIINISYKAPNNGRQSVTVSAIYLQSIICFMICLPFNKIKKNLIRLSKSIFRAIFSILISKFNVFTTFFFSRVVRRCRRLSSFFCFVLLLFISFFELFTEIYIIFFCHPQKTQNTKNKIYLKLLISSFTIKN